MKPKLFENNLTVHKLLGDVSEDELEVRYLAVDQVKDEVVELYQVWDSCMNAVSEQLLGAEDNEKKMKSIESDLGGLTSFLRRESVRLVRERREGREGASTDSGISEGGEARLVREICQQDSRLTNLQTRLAGLAGEPRGVRGDLAESRRQLDLLRSLITTTSQTQARTRRTRRLATLTTCCLVLFFLLLVLVLVTRPRCCDHSNLSYFLLLTYSGGARPI